MDWALAFTIVGSITAVFGSLSYAVVNVSKKEDRDR